MSFPLVDNTFQSLHNIEFVLFHSSPQNAESLQFFHSIGCRPMSARELDKLAYILARRSYEIVSALGVGGYARVFKVRSSKYDKFFAAKVFGMSGQAGKVASFSSEISLLKTLLHQNILLVYDYFYENSLMIIILEYCEGGNVSDIIVDGEGVERRLISGLLSGIVSAFRYLHAQKVAHRDIKPANILLDVYGRPKVADFGLSQRVEDGVSRVWRFGGSTPFAAPEILKHESYNPFAADVWSLGVTIYLIVTGNLPWPVQSYDAMKAAIVKGDYDLSSIEDRDLADVIGACLQVEPEKRSTMNDIMEMKYFSQRDGDWVPRDFLPKEPRKTRLSELGGIGGSRGLVKSMVLGIRSQTASRKMRRLAASRMNLGITGV